MSSKAENRQSWGSKFVRRTSKLLKPKNRDSISGPSESQSLAESSSASASNSKPLVAAAAADTKKMPRVHEPTETVMMRKVPTSADAHYKLQEEKARALFAKYNMNLETGSWATARGTKNTEWLEKPIKIRVHRSCHRCASSFGADKTCQSCKHTRCKKCPRYPEKRSKSAKAKAREGAATTVDVDPLYRHDPSEKVKYVPTMPSKTGGQDHVRRHPVHRVRRTCHQCETIFKGKATQCENCNHQRCKRCPREPPKLKKYPDGYPGDVEETFPLSERVFRKQRHKVRWFCHECDKVFMDGEKECGGCKHPRCDDCKRIPPKKVKKEFHPDVLKSVEEKLAQTSISAGA